MNYKDLNILSKTQIDRLGNKVRKEFPNLSTETLNDLEAFRVSHEEDLSKVFNQLCKLDFNIGKESIFTFRIKRFESIINKLNRLSSMKFNRMGDIGGCRCIVKNDKDVYVLKSKIEKHFIIHGEPRDYVKKPTDDGYKSIHLYVSQKNGGGKVIEIQIRSQKDHNWATLVEISDLLFDAGLKEYKRDLKLLRFHKYLSETENLTYNDKIDLIEIIKEYNYLENLNENFIKNHFKVKEQWLNIETSFKYNYFLVQSTKNEIPIITGFKNFQEAEKEYYHRFNKSVKTNLVLTYLSKPSYKKISVAYSNYIMTTHSFEKESMKIIESLIIDSLEKGKYFKFFKYFDFYQNISTNKLINSSKELKFTLNSQRSYTGFKNKLYNKKINEWRNDMNQDINDYFQEVNNFRRIFRKNFPNKIINRFVFKFLIKYIINKNNRKLKSIYR